MSWMSENYEKAALGGGAVVALLLAFLGWSASSSVEDKLVNPATGSGSNNTAVPGAEELPGTLSSMQAPQRLQPIEEGGRHLDLFTGIALFARKGETEPVDLWNDPPVHPPIPNRWFLEHRIDIGFADAPQRDDDGDGFSNLEEFNAGTDPSDPSSHPPLIAKLTYADQDVIEWLLRWVSDVARDQNLFRYRDSRFPRREFSMSAENAVGPGDVLVFREADCPANGRFRLLEIEEREEMRERVNIPEVRKYATIEDLKENKQGEKYELPRRVTNVALPQQIRRDRTAVLELRAVGYEGKTFKVEERTAFGLPPDSTKKDFFLKEVTDEAITVENRENPQQPVTVVIPKGGFPNLEP